MQAKRNQHQRRSVEQKEPYTAGAYEWSRLDEVRLGTFRQEAGEERQVCATS